MTMSAAEERRGPVDEGDDDGGVRATPTRWSVSWRLDSVDSSSSRIAAAALGPLHEIRAVEPRDAHADGRR